MYFVVILGIATGMRALTPMAVLCWFMWFAILPVSRLNFWTASVVSVVIFTVLALGEYYGDTLPKTPSRKSLPGLLARLVLGALVGVMVFSSFGEPLAGGVVFGVIGSLIGTYGGYAMRMRLARKVGSDFPVAVAESTLALGLSVLSMWMIHGDWILQQTGYGK
jgi:uncharacterized membrane protein